MADPDYNAGIVHEQGGNVLRVKSGAQIVLDAGATLDVSAGTFSGGGTEQEITTGQTLKIDNGAILDASAANAADIKLPAKTIVTASINDAAVTATQLGAKAATTAKIDDAAVTATQLGTGAVTTAKILAGNVTPAKMAFTGIKKIAFVGADASGGATHAILTGAVAGDRVLAIIGSPTAGGALIVGDASFEATITVNDQIQQPATDLSTKTYVALLIPAAA